MRRKEVASLIQYGAIGAVSSLAAVGAFWWLAMYSTICDRDIVGTTIVVWCAVAVKMLMWFEKRERMGKQNEKI